MSDIIERLLDSEEHATDEAIPSVAEDAAEEIGALREQLEIAEACARCEHEKRLGIEQQRDELLAASPATGANHAPR